jgi:hypothetical protein
VFIPFHFSQCLKSL